MSNSHDTTVSSGSGVTSMGSPGTQGTANNQASDLKRSTAEQGKNVAHTAKDEASSVLGEAKGQAKDLYAQTQREVKDQAATQQQRIAAGLRSASDELDSMAANSSTSGLATDLVRQVSDRLSSASHWLDDRDPGSVLEEVKRFARRKPGTFIFAAVVVGVAAGRLTRALASNAKEDHERNTATTVPSRTTGDAWTPPATVGATAPATGVAAPAAGAAAPAAGVDAPIYAQSSSEWADATGTEDGDVRRDTV
jgi:hypothetical protein